MNEIKNRVIMITGGVGSGKSSFALRKAEEIVEELSLRKKNTKGQNSRKPRIKVKKIFIATAEPIDEEMREKIERHKKEREGMGWLTKEEPISPQKYIYPNSIIILECITTWLANLLVKSPEKIDENIQEFIEKLKNTKSVKIVITNEVGFGIIPDSELARKYTRKLAEINRKIAEISDEVYLMVSGISIRIK